MFEKVRAANTKYYIREEAGATLNALNSSKV